MIGAALGAKRTPVQSAQRTALSGLVLSAVATMSRESRAVVLRRHSRTSLSLPQQLRPPTKAAGFGRPATRHLRQPAKPHFNLACSLRLTMPPTAATASWLRLRSSSRRREAPAGTTSTCPSWAWACHSRGRRCRPASAYCCCWWACFACCCCCCCCLNEPSRGADRVTREVSPPHENSPSWLTLLRTNV